MDFSLDSEEQLVAQTIGRLVDKDIARWAADADRGARLPDTLLQVGADVGFLLDAVPEAAGGLLDGDYCHLSRALRGIELGRGCAAMAAVLESNVEPALAVTKWGSEAARSELFSSLAEGALATTGRDFSGSLTVKTDGDNVVIDGAIGPLPALAASSHLLLACSVGHGATAEPLLVLMPTAAFGLKRATPSGWRCADWGTAHCVSTTVPTEFILARGDAATHAINEVLTWYRLSLAARAVGVSIAAMRYAKTYGEERVQFGQPIGSFESIIRLRDRAETSARAARLLVLEAAWKVDAGSSDAADAASRARDFAADTVTRTTIDAVQIYGGYGFVNDYPVEKLMRDAPAFEVLLGNEALSRVLEERPGAA